MILMVSITQQKKTLPKAASPFVEKGVEESDCINRETFRGKPMVGTFCMQATPS